MNRLGMMVDVSHLSDPAFWDIVNTSNQAGDRDAFRMSRDYQCAAESD